MEQSNKKTKKINIFDQTPRQIRCIKKEFDYLDDRTFVTKNELEVGRLYTYIKGSWKSYGSMVFVREVPKRYGFQDYLFEELEEHDEEELAALYRDAWLRTLKESEKDFEKGNYVTHKELMKDMDVMREKRMEENLRQRDPARILPFLNHVAEIWEKYPDLRFGQLMFNAVSAGKEFFYLEDDRLLQMLDEFDNSVSSQKKDVTYRKGHDSGAAYWIMPVKVHISEKITDQDVDELEGEISVQMNFFREHVRPLFAEKLDMELQANRYHYTYAFSDEGRYIAGFEDCMEYNFYSPETIRQIADELNEDPSARGLAELLREMAEKCTEGDLISVMGP